jgi:hypothetical protein
MICYNISPQDLYSRIEKADKNWLGKAKARIALYKKAGSYTGGSEFWGDIKGVFIEIQNEKCAYCETLLAGKEFAKKVHEVEHFRPKSEVQAWPEGAKKQIGEINLKFPTGAACKPGYYLLSYNPLNYAIACTRCNSTLKGCYFPVRGKRLVNDGDPLNMAAEQPLLSYPICNIDGDVGEMLTFDGVLAVPRKKTGSLAERARVMIEFFQLNNEDLTIRRAHQLGAVYSMLERHRLEKSNTVKVNLDSILTRLQSPAGPYSACVKAFVELYRSQRARATQIGNLVEGMWMRSLGS